MTIAVLFSFTGFNAIKADAASSSKELISGKPISGETVVRSARKYVGKLRYSYGGTSLKNGCDCSGFVYAIYKANGIDFKNVRSSYDMYAARNKIGTDIGTDTSKAMAGDIIIYPDHAGLCTSNGTVIQCQSRGLREQPHSYMNRYFGGVQAIIRLNLVRNLKVGDEVSLPKYNAIFKVVKVGKVNKVKHIGEFVPTISGYSASNDELITTSQPTVTKIPKKVKIFGLTYKVVNSNQ
ncbi:MAG: C40 family peptidase [Lachnospiraceae bacterium]|nr:C40 family peptidase [Lachnospiraceae bacterium]